MLPPKLRLPSGLSDLGTAILLEIATAFLLRVLVMLSSNAVAADTMQDGRVAVFDLQGRLDLVPSRGNGSTAHEAHPGREVPIRGDVPASSAPLFGGDGGNRMEWCRVVPA